jgi:hypothetical protein
MRKTLNEDIKIREFSVENFWRELGKYIEKEKSK